MAFVWCCNQKSRTRSDPKADDARQTTACFACVTLSHAARTRSGPELAGLVQTGSSSTLGSTTNHGARLCRVVGPWKVESGRIGSLSTALPTRLSMHDEGNLAGANDLRPQLPGRLLALYLDCRALVWFKSDQRRRRGRQDWVPYRLVVWQSGQRRQRHDGRWCESCWAQCLSVRVSEVESVFVEAGSPFWSQRYVRGRSPQLGRPIQRVRAIGKLRVSWWGRDSEGWVTTCSGDESKSKRNRE